MDKKPPACVQQRLLWTASRLNLGPNCIPGQEKGISLSFGDFYVFLTLGKHVAAAACRHLVFTLVSVFHFCKCQMSASVWRWPNEAKRRLKETAAEVDIILKICLIWNTTLKVSRKHMESPRRHLKNLIFTSDYMCFNPDKIVVIFSCGNIFAICHVASAVQEIKWQEQKKKKITHKRRRPHMTSVFTSCAAFTHA